MFKTLSDEMSDYANQLIECKGKIRAQGTQDVPSVGLETGLDGGGSGCRGFFVGEQVNLYIREASSSMHPLEFSVFVVGENAMLDSVRNNLKKNDRAIKLKNQIRIRRNKLPNAQAASHANRIRGLGSWREGMGRQRGQCERFKLS